jgi:hypothetical protein
VIYLSLSAPAAVDVAILNLAGRPVRTLVANKPLEAGTQTLLWDRHSDAGPATPAGLYLIRVTARGMDGAQSSALATVALR